MSYTLSNLDMGDPIFGATPGAILFVDTDTSLAEDTANLFWDDGTKTMTLVSEPASVLEIGGDSTSVALHAFGTVNTKVMISTETYGTPIILVEHSDTDSPTLPILRSRGTTASPTIVQNGDGIGAFAFAAYDGTDYVIAALVSCDVTGTPADGSMPNTLSAIVFDPDFSPWQAFTFGTAQTTLNSAPGDSTNNDGKPFIITGGDAIGGGDAGIIVINTGTGAAGGEFFLNIRGDATPMIKAARVSGINLLGIGTGTIGGSKLTVDNDGGSGVDILQLQSAGFVRFRVFDSGSVSINSDIANTFLQENAIDSVVGATHTFDKARGSVGSETIVADVDDLGTILFRGHDGTGFVEAAKIIAVVEGTPGVSDMPGRLDFYTTRVGSGSPTRAMTIGQNGYVGIGNFTGPNAALQILQLDNTLNANITQQANGGNATFSVTRYADDSNGGNADYVKTRGDLFTNSPVLANDSIYTQSYYGLVGTNGLQVAARINYQVVGPVTDAVNGLGGSIQFSTSTPGSTVSGRLSIMDEGQLNLAQIAQPSNVVQDGDLWSDSTQFALINRQKATYLTLESVTFTGTNDATVTNTTTEGSIIGSGIGSATLGANFFAPGKTVRVTVRGIYSTAAVPGTLRIRAKLNATTVLDSGANTAVSAGTDRYFEVSGIFTCRTTGVSGTFYSQGMFTNSLTSTTITGWDMENNSTATIDTTGALAVDVTAEWGTADASNSITSTNVTIEVLN